LCAIFVFACHRLSRQAEAASVAEEKAGKGGGKGQGHNDDDAHGRSEKIAGIQLFHTDDDGLGCLLSRII